MPNMTLSVPDDLYAEMKRHPEIRWSEVARQALKRKLEDLRRLDTLLKDSRLSDRDVDELGDQIKGAVWKRHRAKRVPGDR